jgi:hypothetical protein
MRAYRKPRFSIGDVEKPWMAFSTDNWSSSWFKARQFQRQWSKFHESRVLGPRLAASLLDRHAFSWRLEPLHGDVQAGILGNTFRQTDSAPASLITKNRWPSAVTS